MQIVESLFVVPGATANSYVIIDPDGLTVVNAGLRRSEEKVLLGGGAQARGAAAS